MKHAIGIGALVAVAFVCRLALFRHVGLDIYVHDTLHVVPIGLVFFCFMIGIASVWFLILAARTGFGRPQ
jgi:hypothetical protein